MNNTQANIFGSTEIATGSHSGEDEGTKVSVLWWKIALSLVIFIIGTIGNLLSLFVIIVLKEYKKSVLHMYVLQLGIADLLFLLTLPFKVAEDIRMEWPFSDWMCTAKETMLFLNYNASVLFLVVMSIDRYIAVCHSFSPVLTKLREPLAAGCIICSVWLISILSCLPVIHNTHKGGIDPNCYCKIQFPLLLSEIIQQSCPNLPDIETYRNCSLTVEKFFDSTTRTPNCINPNQLAFNVGGGNSVDGGNSSVVFGNTSVVTAMYEDGEFYGEDYANESGQGVANESVAGCHYFGSAARWLLFLRTNFVVLYIIPILVMAVTYGCIIHKIKNTTMANPRKKSTTPSFSNGDNLKRNKSVKLNIRNRVTIMSATLVSSFIICWLPFHAIHLAKIKGISVPFGKGYICDNLLIFASLLAYINSVINPYLYSFLGTDFGKRWRNVETTVRKTVTNRTGQDLSRKTTKLQSADSNSQTKFTNVKRGKMSPTRSSEGEVLA